MMYIKGNRLNIERIRPKRIRNQDGQKVCNIAQLQLFNPNDNGVKYSLIVLGGGFLHHVFVLTSLSVKKYFFFNFELKL